MSDQAITIDVPRRDDLFLVARNQMEMSSCQSRLTSWFSSQIVKLTSDAVELQEAIDIAIRNRWRRGTMQKHLKYTMDRILFFEKCKSAAAEGYAIIPDMDCDVFAIRVDPASGVTPETQEGSSQQWTGLHQQLSDKLPEGEGEYKSSEPAFDTGSYECNAKHPAEGKITKYWRTAVGYADVVFPVVAAKPRIMEAVQQAMAKRLFDDVAIIPKSARQKKRDPMIVGRIHGPKKYKYDDSNVLSFIICWFLDLEQLVK